jgi:heterodisulfide reductase subunit C
MRHGRVFELGTMMSFIARSRRLADMDLGPKALTRGKLALRARDIHGRDEVEKIFRRYREGLEK